MQKKRRIPTLIAGVTILLAGSLAAAVALLNQAERPGATGYISEAETHLLDRKFQSATIAVKNALQLEPNNGKARLVHARLLINAGKGAEALAELERAERAGVQGIRPYRLRAQLLNGEFAKVLGTLAVDPDAQKDTALLIIRGQAALALGRLDNAASAFETALALSPDSREAQIGSAETALKAGQADKAAQFIAPLLHEDTRDSRVSLLHGQIALRQKDPATALAAFKTAKAERATLAADIGQVRALIGLEDLKAAQSLADSLATAHPQSPAVHYWQAAAAAKAGQLEAAVTAYRAVLGLTPNHPESLFSISRLHIERGQFSEAEAALQRLIKAAPEHLPSRKLLAIAQLKNGNPKESMQTLDPGRDGRLADDPHALALRAAALRQIGDSNGADALLARATEIAPAEPAYRVERALGQLSSGQVKAALASLHQAIEIEPDHHKAHALIVLAALAEEDLESALAQAENYAKRYASTAFAHNLHAGVLRRAGQHEQAREALHRAVAIDPEFADAQVNLARIEREKGNIELARSRLEKLVSERTHPAVLGELASIALARGATIEALERFEQIRSEHANDLRSRLGLVGLYLSARRNDDALKVAKEAFRLAPRQPPVLIALTRAQTAAGRLEAATNTARSLIALTPKRPSAHVQLALLLAKANNLDGATQAAQTALTLDPRDYSAILVLGRLALRQGDRENALARAKSLGSLKPERPEGAVLEGDVQYQAGSNKKALMAYRRAQTIRPSTLHVIRIARTLQALGRKTDARAELTSWLERHPEDNAVRQILAMEEHQAGDAETATARYEALLERGGRSIVALNNLAWIYAQHTPKRALALAEEARALAPDHPSVLDTLGWMYHLNGQHQRAIIALERSLTLAPGVAEHEYHLAAALAATGERQRAFQLLESALSKDAPHWKSRDEAASLHEELRKNSH